MKQAHRGDVVVAVFKGAYGEPRPAVVVQADVFRHVQSVVVCLLTTQMVNTPLKIRPTVEAIGAKGRRSQVQVDKILTVHRSQVRQVVGRVSARELLCIDRALAEFLGLKGRRL